MIKAIQAKPITGMTFSPPPAQQSQSESIAAPAEVGQGVGTKHQKGGALLLLLVAIICFVVILKHLDTAYPCGMDPVARMNCKLEQGK